MCTYIYIYMNLHIYIYMICKSLCNTPVACSEAAAFKARSSSKICSNSSAGVLDRAAANWDSLTCKRFESNEQ